MDIDYRLAFEMAPVGLALVAQPHHGGLQPPPVRDVWRRARAADGPVVSGAVPQRRSSLSAPVQRIAPILNRNGTYADDRIMKRLDGRFKGETFWCHVTGRALNQAAPHEAGIWTFEDLSASRPVKAELTAREREVAALSDGWLDQQGNWQGAGHQPPHGGNLPRPPDAQIQGIQHGRPGAQADGWLDTRFSAASRWFHDLCQNTSR